MNATFVCGGLLTNMISIILRFICGLFAQGTLALCGICFKSIGEFTTLSSGNNNVTAILKPVLSLSKDILVPIGLELIMILFVWNLIKAAMGKFSSSMEDPIRLFVRTVVFGMCIGASSLFITETSDLVLSITSNMINAPSSYKIDNKKLANWVKIGGPGGSDNAMSGIYNFIGYTGEQNGISIDISDDYEGSSDKYVAPSTEGKKNKKGETVKTYNNSKGNYVVETISKDGKTKTIKKYKKKGGKQIGKTKTVKIKASSVSNIGSLMLEDMSASSKLPLILTGIILYIIIYGILMFMIAWQLLKCCVVFVRRMATFLIALYMAPLTFAAGPSKSTQNIFEEWCKMLGAYSITLFISAGFMSIAQYVVLLGFIESANESNFIKVAFCYVVVLTFLKIINNLEDYVNRLGFNAVGFNEKEGVTGFIQSAVAFGVTRGATKAIGGAIGNSVSRVKGEMGHRFGADKMMVNSANSQLKGLADGQKKAKADSLMDDAVKGQKNKGSFVNTGANGTGNFKRGIDGKMHPVDSNGKALDGARLDKGDNNRYAPVNSLGKLGPNGEFNAGTNAKLANIPKDCGFAKDNNSPTHALSGDGKMATPLDMLEDGANFTPLDSKGNEYGASSTGDVFAKTKKGSLVNVGNGQTFKVQQGGSFVPRYEATTEDGNYMYNAMNDSVSNVANYDETIPDNAKYVNPENFEWVHVDKDSQAGDGTQTGLINYTLEDGTTVARNITRYANTPVNSNSIQEAMNRKGTSNRYDDAFGFSRDNKFFYVAEGSIKPFDPGRPGKAS